MITATVSRTGMNPSHDAVRINLTRSRRPIPTPQAQVGKRQRNRTAGASEVVAGAVTSKNLPLVRQSSPVPQASAAGEGAFVLYLREIGRVALLTAEEELELAHCIQAGDLDARDRMIQANLRLVVRIARDFDSFGLPLLDLISEGNIGLMTAVDRFDPNRGVRLSTYAALWIKQHMRRAIANHSRTIRVPVHVCEKLVQVNRAASKLEEVLGRAASLEELAAETSLPLDKVRNLRQAIMPTLSLDTASGPDESGYSIAETLADDRMRLAYDHLNEGDVHGMLGDAIHLLNSREQEILRRRFGLDGDEPQTLDQVGAQFGLTRERIRQLQEGALRKLRQRLRKKVDRNL